MHYALARPATLDPVPWQTLMEQVRALVAHANRDSLVICGPFGEGDPMITDEAICLNGNAHRTIWQHARLRNGLPLLPDGCNDDAHEDLFIPRTVRSAARGGRHYTSIDTGGKPYERIVLATLLLVRQHYPHVEVIADDATPATWEVA